MFDLKSAAEESKGSIYQKPGIYDNVTITKVNSGVASTGSKYLQFETVGEDGVVGKSPQMYLNNEDKGNGKPTAWAITARNLKNYLVATHNCTPEEATEMISGVASVEALQAKVSALLVGRKFRAKFNGVQTSKGAIIAELSGSESMKVPATESKLRYDETKDFKPYQGTLQTSQPVMSATDNVSDLPF